MKELSTQKTELRQLSLLVADGSSSMAELLAAALKGIGVGRVIKTTGSEATFKALSSEKFDAVIVDFRLGPLSAAELTIKLRRSRGQNAHAPVIALGSSLSASMVAEALRAGVGAVLTKPVSAETLRRRLIEVVGSTAEPTLRI